jgi:hypothetical protein
VGIIKFKKGETMAQQVPENIGCDNEECVAKDICKRNAIHKDGTAVAVKTFGGTPEKKM